MLKYTQGWEVVRAEHLQALWKEKYSEWQKRPKSKCLWMTFHVMLFLQIRDPFLKARFCFLKLKWNIFELIAHAANCLDQIMRSTNEICKESHKTEVMTQCFIPSNTYRKSHSYWSMTLTYTSSIAKSKFSKWKYISYK